MTADGVEARSGLTPSVEQALFDRRIVMVSGRLDSERAGRVAAALMTLDALGDDPIELRINGESDSLDAAFAVIDTIDVLGVPVNANVAGSVGGTVVGVVAVCAKRRIGSSGRIHLREPQGEMAGVASELQKRAADLQDRLERFVRRLAEAIDRPFEHVEADMRSGRYFDAESALAYGLVDEVVGGRSR